MSDRPTGLILSLSLLLCGVILIWSSAAYSLSQGRLLLLLAAVLGSGLLGLIWVTLATIRICRRESIRYGFVSCSLVFGLLSVVLSRTTVPLEIFFWLNKGEFIRVANDSTINRTSIGFIEYKVERTPDFPYSHADVRFLPVGLDEGRTMFEYWGRRPIPTPGPNFGGQNVDRIDLGNRWSFTAHPRFDVSIVRWPSRAKTRT